MQTQSAAERNPFPRMLSQRVFKREKRGAYQFRKESSEQIDHPDYAATQPATIDFAPSTCTCPITGKYCFKTQKCSRLNRSVPGIRRCVRTERIASARLSPVPGLRLWRWTGTVQDLRRAACAWTACRHEDRQLPQPDVTPREVELILRIFMRNVRLNFSCCKSHAEVLNSNADGGRRHARRRAPPHGLGADHAATASRVGGTEEMRGRVQPFLPGSLIRYHNT